jgi:hypothetical protein
MIRKFMLRFLLVLCLPILACTLTPTIAAPAIPSATAIVPSVETAALVSPVEPATNTPTSTETPTPTIPTATASPTPSLTPAPTATNTLVPLPNPSKGSYIDDRSTASQVIVSLYNAINRGEYLRAYSYWDDPAITLGDFNAYASGYQDTASVSLVFGQITGDAGMSQVYYSIPVILKATAGNGNRTNYAACYVVHETSPDVYGAPPFAPMGIYQGSATIADLHASDASVLSTACNGSSGGSMQVSIAGESLSIDKSNFLDNRSGSVETVSSFLNALNRKQYVRAYSYYQNPASYPGAYEPYAAGYADTDGITVVFGTVLNEGAAGSLYYKVPLALHVLTTSNTKQTFVGCYTLRLAQPAVQGIPPFQPMGIIAGKFQQVNNSVNVIPMLPTACN